MTRAEYKRLTDSYESHMVCCEFILEDSDIKNAFDFYCTKIIKRNKRKKYFGTLVRFKNRRLIDRMPIIVEDWKDLYTAWKSWKEITL